MLSGLKATVFMKDGQTLDKEALTKVFESKKLALLALEQEKLVMPEAAYLITKTGGT